VRGAVKALLSFGTYLSACLCLLSCTTTVPDTPPSPSAPTMDGPESVRQGMVGVQGGSSIGLGLVVSDAGQILITDAVLEAAAGDPVAVRAAGGGELGAATPVGSDPVSGLAVIELETAADLVPVRFGDSSRLEPGEEVQVLGGLPGEQPSSVLGTVRDTGARGAQLGVLEIEIDAEPALGGGIVVNTSGEVVGVVTSTTPESVFALPSDIARIVVDQLVRSGRVIYAYLGVAMEDAPAGGALIQDVPDGGPADAAGLRPGDVIVRFGERTIDDAGDLLIAVQSSDVGDEFVIGLERDGAEQEVTVSLDEAPAQ
jgi:S1-C subfamily serine protease